MLLTTNARPAHALEPKVAYLNVSDGTTALFGAPQDDATLNLSGIATVVPYPAFAWPQSPNEPALSAAQASDYLLFALHKAFLPYNLVWTDVRPLRGPYTMVVVGGRPELLGFDSRVAGVALMDCNDTQPSNIVFAFPSALPGNLHGLFVTAAQETAHAFGLEHTDDEADIMHAQLGAAQWAFTDRPNPIAAPRTCGPLMQNSHKKLLEVLGEWPGGGPKPLADGRIPDVTPPVISIKEPVAGQTVPSHFRVSVTVADESPLAETSLQTAGGSRVHTKPNRNEVLEEQIELAEGPASLVVWARDENGNQSFSSVDFVVEPSPFNSVGCDYAASRRTSKGALPAPAMAIFVLILAWGTCRRV
jgi:hypothetical protein